MSVTPYWVAALYRALPDPQADYSSMLAVHWELECLCGDTKGTIVGPTPLRKICHCRDCKKITGGMYSDHLVVQDENISYQGKSFHTTHT
ncbi:uncharacterized protein GGS25DRAFT_519723 [Hypoxylon fragiforme]|uniref:uncharacterized protein n=1 Tax=Hypoxylon fragiforme TaxID=63214 RepID=UPI0020C66588|nr:uncharacterized protein GGS25DRAFT_519723 [Hypoxylon fragiforme]KAI2611415.1 hypothetical protein GGS25DRAFT_519723 [Hypoxylon fragiforme]